MVFCRCYLCACTVGGRLFDENVFADADASVVSRLPLWLRGSITDDGVTLRSLAVEERSLRSRQLPGSPVFHTKW